MKGFVTYTTITISKYDLSISKEDVYDILDFLYENDNSDVVVMYNRKLEVLLFKTNKVTLVKILPNNQVKVTESNVSNKFKAIDLHNVLDKQLEKIREEICV